MALVAATACATATPTPTPTPTAHGSSAPPLIVGAADDPSLRSGVRPTTPTPTATDPRAAIVRAAREGGACPLEVERRSSGGAVLLVRGARGRLAECGAVLADLGPPALLVKVTNVHNVLELAEQGGDDAKISFYLKLDRASMPDEPAIRRALRDARFDAQTVAGDVVTGLAPVGALAGVLALPWVAGIEPPAKVRPR
jgi:hypothetical protein